MLKIVLSLLFFCIIPTDAMLQPIDTFYTIPNHTILTYMFPKANDQLWGLATLIKKFGYQDDTKKTLTPIIENLLPLLYLSQTNIHFHNKLAEEIKNKTELSHVSFNSIVTYFDHSCHSCRNKNYNYGYECVISIFSFKNINSQCNLFVNVTLENDQQLKLRDESEAINIHKLCTVIMKQCKYDKSTQDVCKDLQRCTTTLTMPLKYVDQLKQLLIYQRCHRDIDTFNKYISAATLTQSPILALNIMINDKNKFKNVIDCHLDNENLVSILSKYISTLNNNVLTTYWHSYYSFLQKLRLTTLDSFNSNNHVITFKTNCGSFDEPNIPVGIICPADISLSTIQNK